MPTLYDLTQEYAVLLERIYDAADDDGAVPLDLAAELSAIGESLEHKAEGCCMVLQDLQAHEAACKAESDRLTKRARALANRTQWLKDYLKESMLAIGERKLTAGVFKLSVCNNSMMSVTVEKLDDVPHKFDDIPERQICMADIREAIKRGEVVPGVVHHTGTHLRVS